MRHLLARPKLGLIAAAVAALGATPTHSATVSWIGGTSFWDLVANWNSNPPALPGSADDVLIDVAGVQTVTYRSGTSTISSLTIAGDDLLDHGRQPHRRQRVQQRHDDDLVGWHARAQWQLEPGRPD